MRYAGRLMAVLIAVLASSAVYLATAPTADAIDSGAPVSTAPETDMVGRPVYLADGEQVGRIDAVETGGNGRIVSVDVAIQDSLALGPKVVRVPGHSITRTGLKVRLALTAEELGLLPDIDGEPE